jgi:hypothetical protein
VLELLALEVSRITGDAGINYICDACSQSIQGERVHCMECLDFDLCVSCHQRGVSVAPHDPKHQTQVVGGSSVPAKPLDPLANDLLNFLGAAEERPQRPQSPPSPQAPVRDMTLESAHNKLVRFLQMVQCWWYVSKFFPSNVVAQPNVILSSSVLADPQAVAQHARAIISLLSSN